MFTPADMSEMLMGEWVAVYRATPRVHEPRRMPGGL